MGEQYSEIASRVRRGKIGRGVKCLGMFCRYNGSAGYFNLSAYYTTR